MISYYELLGMVKNKTNPKKVKHENKIYIWDGMDYSLNGFSNYLSGYFHESKVFEKNIEIIEEDKDIEEIKMNGVSFYSEYVESWISKESNEAFNEYLANKLNEVIREVNKLKRGCN